MAKVKEETKVIKKKQSDVVSEGVEIKPPKGKLIDGKLFIKRRNYNQGMAGTDVVTVECPFCPDEHQHRISSELIGNLGDKTSHCVPGKRYSLIESDADAISTQRNIRNNVAIKEDSLKSYP